MRRKLAYIGLLLVACGPLRAEDAARVHLVAPAWGLTLAADGTGFYNELADILLDLRSGKVKYDIQPYRRARRYFYASSGACIYPFSIKYFQESGDDTATKDLIESDWLLSTQGYLFAQPGQTPPDARFAIKGKRVGFPMGAQSDKYFTGAGGIFIAVEKEEDKARMLLSGRVDYLAANMPDAKFVFDYLGVPVPPYDKSAPFSVTGIHIVCQNTSANQAFMQWYDARQDALIQSGELAAFFNKHGLMLEDYLHRE